MKGSDGKRYKIQSFQFAKYVQPTEKTKEGMIAENINIFQQQVKPFLNYFCTQ